MKLGDDFYINVRVTAQPVFRIPPEGGKEKMARERMALLIEREGRKFNAMITDKLEAWIESQKAPTEEI